jgi:hypothetical protein
LSTLLAHFTMTCTGVFSVFVSGNLCAASNAYTDISTFSFSFINLTTSSIQFSPSYAGILKTRILGFLDCCSKRTHFRSRNPTLCVHARTWSCISSWVFLRSRISAFRSSFSNQIHYLSSERISETL